MARNGSVVRWSLLAGAISSALAGGGCNLTEWAHNDFKVGPNYSRPPAPMAENWIDYRDPRVKSQEQDLREWWRVFGDPALDALVDGAYQQNLTLRVAGGRILAARAQRGIAVGNLFPQVQQAFGEYTRNKLSSTSAQPATEQWFQDWNGGFTASWELDFWGRFRRAIEATDAELDAAIENYDDVLVILLADVASNYVQIRIFQERLDYAWQNVVSQYIAFSLANDKFKAGAATERDMQQAKQVWEETKALIPALEAGIRLANNRLCTLLGIPPRELTELQVGVYERELQTKLGGFYDGTQALEPGQLDPIKMREDVPKPPRDNRQFEQLGDLFVGVPADLLRRRPDVRRAERQVAAQSARIGIAEADLYPRFSLNGTIGLEAAQFADLFQTPDSLFGSIGPSFRWDILNYGRILNNVLLQDARFQELAFAYQNSVLTAGQEVDDGIVGFLKAQERTRNLRASVAAAERTVEISFEQYRQGAIDFTPVVLFESTLANQEDRFAVTRGDIALSLIATYRALGGGWEMRLTRDGNGCAQVNGMGPVVSMPGGGANTLPPLIPPTPEQAPMPAPAQPSKVPGTIEPPR